jgi:hypothetical protein
MVQSSRQIAQNKKTTRAIKKLKAAGLPVTPANIQKAILEAKAIRVAAHTSSMKEAKKVKRKVLRKRKRVLKFDRQTIRVMRTYKKDRKVFARDLALYGSLKRRRNAALAFYHQIDIEMAKIRARRDAYVQSQKQSILDAVSLSKISNRPVRCGDHPLYLAHLPDAPVFPQPNNLCLSWFIYVLVDPKDKTVRYVGKTKDLSKVRYRSSVYNKNLYKWKKSTNFKFGIEIVSVVSYKDREQAEKEWVSYYRNIGKIYNTNLK